MSKLNNTNKESTGGYVLVNRRANSTHPLFKGDGYALAIFLHLAANMAHKRTTDSLGKTENKVPLDRTQVLTSYRTLVAGLGFSKWVVESRIKKLVEGVRDSKGIIKKEPCENMPGLTRNDGMVITILSGAKFGSDPDTSQDAKPDYSNTNTNKRKKFTPPTCDEVLAYAVEKDWPNAKNLADKFFEYYDGTGWIKEKVGKPVRNWKLTMCDWQDRQSSQPSIKVVKRTGKSSYTPAGPEALMYHDTATTKAAAKSVA